MNLTFNIMLGSLMIPLNVAGCACGLPLLAQCGSFGSGHHHSQPASQVLADTARNIQVGDSIYVCPMGHGRWVKSGNCPTCGMKLVAKAIQIVPATSENGAQLDTLYVCPMNDFVSSQAGRCPKCGMTLQKQIQSSSPSPAYPAPLSPPAKTVYTCPMGHGQWDNPGKCPKCGMELAGQSTNQKANSETTSDHQHY